MGAGAKCEYLQREVLQLSISSCKTGVRALAGWTHYVYCGWCWLQVARVECWLQCRRTSLRHSWSRCGSAAAGEALLAAAVAAAAAVQ
jgi:hypothetical protein